MPNKGSFKFPAGALARPEYRPGNYLLPGDLQTGQRYLQQRLRRHNRLLHGPGVVCGMSVVPANDSAYPWGVYICPGYAIGPYGDEIELRRRVLLDIEDYLWTYFTAPGLPQIAYAGIRYIEELDKPVAAPVPSCQCDETTYTPSRIKDSYQLAALWANPQESTQPFDICSQGIVACDACPESPYLLLAQINLPASVGSSIVAGSIVSL
jgi:hypothetical protein